MATKKRNPADKTERNLRPIRNRTDILEKRVKILEAKLRILTFIAKEAVLQLDSVMRGLMTDGKKGKAK